MKRICIIGLGWLGEQVADFLTLNGYLVSGTTTNQTKLVNLSSKLHKVYLADIESSSSWTAISYSNYDFFLLTIPPSSVSAYAKKMFSLVQKIYAQNPKAQIIYTSSTSVYGNQKGQYDEFSSLNPLTKSAMEISKFESLVFSKFPHVFSSIRLGGLCGGSRHPVFHLSNKKILSKPDAAVNLIHVEDVSRFISFFLTNNSFLSVINLCSTKHPKRKDYYEWAAHKLNIAIPNFDESDKLKDKTVICKGLINLGFKLKYASPYEYPELN